MADILNRYQPFPRHEDNVGEIISADHINSVEQEVETEEKSLFQIRDDQFLDRCLFILENHPVANSMWTDDLSDFGKIDNSQFIGLVLSAAESSVSLNDSIPANTGTLFSLPYTLITGASVQQIILMADDYQPSGTTISYFVSNDGGNTFTPITPNVSTPIQLATSSNKLVVQARFDRAAGQPSPVLYSWAVLYQDSTYVPYMPAESVISATPIAAKSISHWDLVDVQPDQHHAQRHSHNGIDGSGTVSHKDLTDIGEDDHHPKLHRHSGFAGENSQVDLRTEVKGTLPERNLPISLFTGMPGTTKLYKNPMKGDRVERVTSPDGDSFLFFDDNGQLTRVITIMGPVATDEYFDFGIDAAGKYGLLDIRKFVKDIQEPDIQAILSGTSVDITNNSSWFMPYDPTTTIQPSAPTGFVVTLTNSNEPSFAWDLSTDSTIMGYIIFYAYGTTAAPTTPWTEWTATVPAPASQYDMPLSLPGGSYVFAIASVNNDGIRSDLTVWNSSLTVTN